MSNRTPAMPSRPEENPYDLSSQYKLLKILGWGGFGVVLRCLKKDTQETVAIKVPIYVDSKKEATLMKRFMRRNFDQHNIVKLLDSFNTRFGKALVFEELDISLIEFFVKNGHRPMLLSDIRSVIRQTATALEAIKSMGVIHTDIKPDNIMLLDRRKRPLEVKMIDFGLAMPVRKATQGMMLQTEEFRAPEVILGLPLTEAIDMWSLGCVMAIMVAGGLLFSGDNDYEILQDIVHLLGQPPDCLLNNGLYTKKCFIQTKTGGWRFKTPQEYWGYETDNRRIGLSSLDDLKKARHEKRNKAEGLEREQCIELLKSMLTLDATKRITPSQVLSHPFILWTEVDDTSRDDSSVSSWTSTSEDSDTTEDSPQLEDQQKECTYTMYSQLSQPLVIYIRPAPPENTVQKDRLQPGLTKPEPFVRDKNNDMRDAEKDTWMPEHCQKKQPPLLFSPVSEPSPKKKKKKNCFQRFYSWVKKNLC